ncbi:SDR family NAD(P)-dependent oxidoreductase [Chondrinema litorale]|uniref:SDR family NAD(P)-dependent oxidoreductase n=1 Tax=Chondrinema litorale TaxID=2994555 RepID=UPI0025432BF0|nr:SDR family oxidoreductase [Chondrinema litorale]UZR96925.1 SDR family oxidoreductase [Chondrinema litorale]
MSIENKTAIVTGGGSGIGLGIAQRFDQEGANVTICGRTESKLKDAVATMSERASYKVVDVSNEESVKEFIQSFESIDILCTCAGGGWFGPVESVPMSDVRRLLDTRFYGQFMSVHYAVPIMGEGSNIIFCSGIADKKGLPLFSAGNAIDGALNAVAKGLAVELADKGIRVNAVSPGLIQTNISNNLTQEQMMEFGALTLAQIPMKRPGQPSEVAQAAYFLATSTYVNGQIVEVDGGWTA